MSEIVLVHGRRTRCHGDLVTVGRTREGQSPEVYREDLGTRQALTEA